MLAGAFPTSPLSTTGQSPWSCGPTSATASTLWAWSEADFLRATEGSAIRRIGFVRWQRNLAVALGNALASGELQAQTDAAMREALSRVRPTAGDLLAEHIDWALGQRPATGEKPCPPGEGSAAPR